MDNSNSTNLSANGIELLVNLLNELVEMLKAKRNEKATIVEYNRG
ncbi:MAG: hypothetical protein AAFV80_16835 [Bacteroidota bacterium]